MELSNTKKATTDIDGRVASQALENNRDSAIELLRIIAMAMIVLHHFVQHGGFDLSNTVLSLPSLWCGFIKMGGKIGVDIFVLISGYFLISGRGALFNLKRVLKFWLQVEFYSLAAYALSVIFKMNEFGVESLIKAVFPISFSTWWFASTYFVLFLIHPFLNKLLNSLDKKAFQKLLVLLTVCWCVIPTFLMSSYQSNYLLWFVTLYCIAAYIRLWGFNTKIKRKHYALFAAASAILCYLSWLILNVLAAKQSFFARFTTHFYEANTLLVLVISVCLFMIFATMKISYLKWINVIASTTFGVYLIHDSAFGRELFWVRLFKTASFRDSAAVIPYSIFVVIAVYVICTTVELLRQRLLEKPIVNLAGIVIAPFEKLFRAVTDMFCKWLFGKQP